MPRRALVAATLAVLIALTGALPAWVAPAAAASCSSWTSQTDPPPTIRVFRHATGAVDTVDFRAYAKNVLSREWIGSWTTESLRSGALAVKHYAWYQVLHWRGGVNTAGECFDVRDDTYDQVYDPSKATWSSAAAAVDATWSTRVLKNGSIFPTYYNAGTAYEACGVNATGWKLWQWGSQACGLDGKTASEIMQIYYYPGVTVTGAPAATSTPAPSTSPSPTPTPVPTATPAPTATPIPSTANPAATPLATPVPTPAPTATPQPTPTATPTPTASPQPTPPPLQQLPGGGQTGVAGAAAPPPPPAVNPSPVVVQAGADDPTAPRAMIVATDIEGFVTEYSSPDSRLETFRTLWGPAAERLLAALARGLASDGGLVLRFVGPS
ncbi:MAG: SpoIID/LytB domain-containing protein [Candidatus Limnocylindria bacterium]